MKVSAIVVTFNRLNLLKECLEHLLNQTFELNSIIVVNNNSSDGTKEYLHNLNNKKIIPVNLNENLGGAGGFSEGIKFAYKNTNSDYFWIMDDDTMPNVDSLEHLVDSSNFLNNDFGFLCSNVKWWKDNTPTNVPGDLPGKWNNYLENGLVKLSNATFVSVMIPRKIVSELGLPKSEMFIFGDDLEYTHRISKNYENCYMVGKSIAIHKSKKNDVGEKILYEDGNTRINFAGLLYRNFLYIDRLYYSKRKFFMDLISFILLAFKIPFKSRNNIFKRIRVMVKGIIGGILFNPKIKYMKNK